MNNMEIKILIRPSDFQRYNKRLPSGQDELNIFAEKVKTFVEQAMQEEDPRMYTCITTDCSGK